MAVSFEVTLSNMTVYKYVSRACFAPVNHVLSNDQMDRHNRVNAIKYLPFFQRYYSEEDCMNLEGYKMTKEMSWELATKWWDYLMTLPFITDSIKDDLPSTTKGYKSGLKVTTDMPADRMMLTLFLLRAPQYQPNIVRVWDRVMQQHDTDPDTALVTSFAINSQHASDMIDTESFNPECSPLDSISPLYSCENTIVYPQYFSIIGAKIMLNRLLCDDYDKELFGGTQDYFRDKSHYNRYATTDPKALGRFFCKKPASSYRTGNLQARVAKDILGLEDVSKHSNLDYRRRHELAMDKEQIAQLIKLIES